MTSTTIVIIPDALADSVATGLTVVVRDGRRPASVVEGAQVRVTRADTPAASLASIRDSLTTTQGIVTFDAVAPGRYDVLVRRVGMFAARTRVDLASGCRSALEVYLVVVECDIGDCPPSPEPRATFTTCPRQRL